MDTVTITLGRNIGSDPMPAHTWAAFARAASATLATTYGTYAGTGEWDGVREDSVAIVGTVDDVAALRLRLAGLAAEFCQDAVGLIVHTGTDTLVPALAMGAVR